MAADSEPPPRLPITGRSIHTHSDTEAQYSYICRPNARMPDFKELGLARISGVAASGAEITIGERVSVADVLTTSELVIFQVVRRPG